jgi:hypothetical protein
MRIDRAIVILRHNTQLCGDVRLAAREFHTLVGVHGQSLAGRSELIAALGGSHAAHIPELSSNSHLVGMMWKGASVEGLTRLVRRSAFAQEVFISDADALRLEAFRKANPAVCGDMLEFTGPVLVAIAWNYLIESEGTLDEAHREGRVQRTLNLLLEPYRYAESSRASLKLR